jgi:nicotinate-nucleotide adenylyltransferase
MGISVADGAAAVHRPPPIGVFGGTFDPMHYGHLRLAEELGEVIGATHVRIVPAGLPPHRGQPRAAPEHRLAMAELAVADNPRFVLDAREIKKLTPSYSIETLQALRQEVPADTPLVLFMGADAFLGLTTWRRWQELLDFAHIAVAHRPGFSTAMWEDALSEPLRKLLAIRRTEQPMELSQASAGKIFLHAITQLDISASQIRAYALRGKSLQYLLPAPLIQYITENRLYA